MFRTTKFTIAAVLAASGAHALQLDAAAFAQVHAQTDTQVDAR